MDENSNTNNTSKCLQSGFSGSNNLEKPDNHTQSLSFFITLYQSLFKLSNEKVDMVTIFQLTNFPLILCDKLIKVFTSWEGDKLSQDDFSFGFNVLYYGSLIEKTKLIGMLCDFKHNETVWINDVKLLLLHFHIRVFSDQTENEVTKIVADFFGEDEYLKFEEFVSRSIEKNFDVIKVFIGFFEKYKFFNSQVMKFFESVQMKMMYRGHNKGLNKTAKISTLNTMLSTTITNGNMLSKINNTSASLQFKNIFNKSGKENMYNITSTLNEEHIFISDRANDYFDKIGNAKMNRNPFDDDDDMRKGLDQFEKDLSNALVCFKRQANLDKDMSGIVLNEVDYKNLSNYSNSARSQDDEVQNDSVRKNLKNFFYYNSIKMQKITKFLDAYSNSDSKEKEKSYNRSLYLKYSPCEPVTKKEILCYKLSKNLNKFKPVKLILVHNVIFMYSFHQKTQNYIFKKMIAITQLYPKEIKLPFLPQGVFSPFKTGNAYPNDVLQLQIVSCLRNYQKTFDFYTENKEDFHFLYSVIQSVQNIRAIDSVYDLKEELGHGRFGKVCMGVHLLTGKKVAVKIVSKYEKEHTEENFRCSQWEKDIFTFLCHVNNKNVERCYEFFETPNYLYYVNEYISGGDLKNLILQAPIAKSVPLINELIKQFLKGLSTIHKYGIIHRDIKHTNTLVNIENNKFVEIKLIDFGLSKVMGLDETTSEHYGSLSFKAPELITGAKYNFTVDVWALGITIYFMIYGTYPLKAENKHLLKKKIVTFNLNPTEFIKIGGMNDYMNVIMLKALTKDYRKRPSSFQLARIKVQNEEYSS